MNKDYCNRCGIGISIVFDNRTPKGDMKISDIAELAETLASKVADDVAINDDEEDALCEDIKAVLAKHFMK